MKNQIIFSGLLVIFGLLAFNIKSNKSLQEDEDFVYDFVDEMPKFPGGKVGLNKYIKDNLHYPKRINTTQVKAKVYTECIIEKDGEVTHEIVYKNMSKKLENEALKVIKKMPHWIPGKTNGKAVRVRLSIPIEFQ